MSTQRETKWFAMCALYFTQEGAFQVTDYSIAKLALIIAIVLLALKGIIAL